MGKPHTPLPEEHGAWDKDTTDSSTRGVNSKGLKIGIKFSAGEINELWKTGGGFLEDRVYDRA